MRAIVLLHHRPMRIIADGVNQGGQSPRAKPRNSFATCRSNRITGWLNCQKNIALPPPSSATVFQVFLGCRPIRKAHTVDHSRRGETSARSPHEPFSEMGAGLEDRL